MPGEQHKTEFCREEVRCEFVVSEKRKKIWQVQIGLIEQIHALCDKYHLRYFASNGTLLGVVRHQGYIPWDDDVDIVMPRPDYDRFMEVAEKELKHPYTLQVADKEGIYFRNYARLRNSETTAMTARGWDRDCCNGIFVDIFPLDGRPKGALAFRWQQFWFSLYCAMANTHTYYDDFEKRNIMRVVLNILANMYCGIFSYERLLARIEAIRKKADYRQSEYVCQIAHGGRFITCPRSYFDETLWEKFEYIKLPIPKAYDQILTEHYGDYRKLPPVEKRGMHHTIFFDPDKSYTEYLGKLSRDEAKKHFNDY